MRLNEGFAGDPAPRVTHRPADDQHRAPGHYARRLLAIDTLYSRIHASTCPMYVNHCAAPVAASLRNASATASNSTRTGEPGSQSARVVCNPGAGGFSLE